MSRKIHPIWCSGMVWVSSCLWFSWCRPWSVCAHSALDTDRGHRTDRRCRAAKKILIRMLIGCWTRLLENWWGFYENVVFWRFYEEGSYISPNFHGREGEWRHNVTVTRENCYIKNLQGMFKVKSWLIMCLWQLTRDIFFAKFRVGRFTVFNKESCFVR